MNFSKFLLNSVFSTELFDHQQRLAHYRHWGMNAKDAYIWSGVFFSHDDLSNITLGARTFINHLCHIENGDSITLEDDVCLAPGVQLLTTTHEIGGPLRRVGNGCVRGPIKIGRGSWICAGAIILPGVTIGPGCIIAAGAIVRKNCLPNGIYAGVPAKRITDLEPGQVRHLVAA